MLRRVVFIKKTKMFCDNTSTSEKWKQYGVGSITLIVPSQIENKCQKTFFFLTFGYIPSEVASFLYMKPGSKLNAKWLHVRNY